jgi:hypothetical protein
VRQIGMPGDEKDHCCGEKSFAHLWLAAFGKKMFTTKREAHEGLQRFPRAQHAAPYCVR